MDGIKTIWQYHPEDKIDLKPTCRRNDYDNYDIMDTPEYETIYSESYYNEWRKILVF